MLSDRVFNVFIYLFSKDTTNVVQLMVNYTYLMPIIK